MLMRAGAMQYETPVQSMIDLAHSLRGLQRVVRGLQVVCRLECAVFPDTTQEKLGTLDRVIAPARRAQPKLGHPRIGLRSRSWPWPVRRHRVCAAQAIADWVAKILKVLYLRVDVARAPVAPRAGPINCMSLEGRKSDQPGRLGPRTGPSADPRGARAISSSERVMLPLTMCGFGIDQRPRVSPESVESARPHVLRRAPSNSMLDH